MPHEVALQEKNALLRKRLVKRRRLDRAFAWLAKGAVGLVLLLVVGFFGVIIAKAIPSFFAYSASFEVEQQQLTPSNATSYGALARTMQDIIQHNLPPDTLSGSLSFAQKHDIKSMFDTDNIFKLKSFLEKKTASLNSTNTTQKNIIYFSFTSPVQSWLNHPHKSSSLTDYQRSILTFWQSKGLIQKRFAFYFFTNADSGQIHQAGILGALVGSLYVILIVIVLSFVVGVLAGLYLEEFAPKNIITTIIEISINNLTSVPSILFGLFGLSVFLTTLHMPRSSALVGGVVLTLMTLPHMIIITRSSLAAVPSSIKQGALALGASYMQMIFHHALPLALPRIITGTLIGFMRAFGETAPLLMLGMVSFVAKVPSTPLAPATTLPVQIYIWANNPDPAFADKASAAILVLLIILVVVNFLSFIVRKRLERFF